MWFQPLQQFVIKYGLSVNVDVKLSVVSLVIEDRGKLPLLPTCLRDSRSISVGNYKMTTTSSYKIGSLHFFPTLVKKIFHFVSLSST